MSSQIGPGRKAADASVAFADVLDELTGGWLRALADAGRLDGLLTAIAIDGKWLRGVADGQVKLFAAMLQEEKVMIAQHRIPDEITETTQVKALLDIVDLERARQGGPWPGGQRAVYGVLVLVRLVAAVSG